MSYRDVRNFTEMMRALGYTRLISMENFRNPNFPLVAEILIWLVKRFDPDADIPSDYDTEMDRVMLIRSAAQFMATKSHIKLNTKKLYQADGYAVRELLKATTVLYNALKINSAGLTEENSEMVSPIDISSKVHELKKARQLASQITIKGAGLYDLLGREVEMREIRMARVNRQLEITEVESALHQSMDIIRSEIRRLQEMTQNVAATEASLDNKIEKKKLELDRNQKRLQTLKKVRPAFLEELERLEAELRGLYGAYLTRLRCLAYLDQQQEAAEAAEQERMAERQAATRRLLEAMRQDERQLEAAGAEGPGSAGAAAVAAAGVAVGAGDAVGAAGGVGVGGVADEALGRLPGKASRVRIQTASRVMRRASAGVQQRRVFGSMAGPADEEDDSLDSDSDLLLDGEGSELLGSEEEDEDEEEELALGADGLALVGGAHGARAKPAPEPHSDDDF
ncbi:hypothetical protein R5R35_009079 [Gryllus longicercus]|uniref:Clusterin-associated protein 1 n=1 Tax=Gryllus longicercus TaxID=2509291 RepID=A0AAN9ZDS0_9ORTH